MRNTTRRRVQIINVADHAAKCLWEPKTVIKCSIMLATTPVERLNKEDLEH